jgi:hypothetical protein
MPNLTQDSPILLHLIQNGGMQGMHLAEMPDGSIMANVGLRLSHYMKHLPFYFSSEQYS